MQVALTPVTVLSLIEKADPGALMEKGREQLWHRKRFLGLRCDLSALPPIRRAKFEITMTPREPAEFEAFKKEFWKIGPSECFAVFQRIRMCESGVRTLHCCDGQDGSPAYAQWLIAPGNQHILHRQQPNRYPNLASDEVLLEGAYTFNAFRGFGLMTDGMGQLLQIAKNEGAHTAFTYVADDNVPSLRGCANVGFRLDHLRVNSRRFGVHASRVSLPDELAIKTWESATSMSDSK